MKVIGFTPEGKAKTIYSEEFDLSFLGQEKVTRASHVEPTDDAKWTADMTPSGGPVLGPYDKRSEALAAEVEWLNNNLTRRV